MCTRCLSPRGEEKEFEQHSLSPHGARAFTQRGREPIPVLPPRGTEKAAPPPSRHRASHWRGLSESVPACSARLLDRKSTRLNSSHANISYAFFCLNKKINNVR